MSTELTGPGELDDREPSRDEASRPDHDHDGHHVDHAPGEVIAGRYELGAVIGRGGSAAVYRAWDRDGERPVALKRYPAGVTGPDRFRQDQELHALSGLDHPGLVAMHDAGTDGERPYLVMQLVDGPSLTERLVDGPLPVPDAVEIGRHLASALRYVHAHGITHRDVKPANVLLDDGRRPLLADFGIALLVDTARVTSSDAVVGTAAYLAPEQVRGEAIGPPADIYALGLVLIESITGASAYPGTSTESVVARLHHGPAVPPDLPGGCTPLLRRMTAVDAARRPDARGVVGELAAVADRIAAGPVTAEPIAADPIAGGPVPAGPNTGHVARGRVTGEETGATVVAAPDHRRRRRLVVALCVAAGAVVVAVAGGSVAGLTAGRSPAPAAVAGPAQASPSAAAPVVAPPVSVMVDPPVVPAPPASAGVSSGASSGRSGGFDPSDRAAAPEPSPVEMPVQRPDASSSEPPTGTDNGGNGDDSGGGSQQNGERHQDRHDHHGSDDGSEDRDRSSDDDD